MDPRTSNQNSIDASGEVMEYGSSNDQRMQDMEIWPSDGGGVEEYDPWTAWLYKPHTVSVLLAGACLLIWASGVFHPEITSSHDKVIPIKRGVWAMIAVFLAYCTLQAPSTILIRPHPAVWRLVHGMAVVYLVALTFLLFQKRDDARQFMKHLHPGLGNYQRDHMDLTAETLFDEFVIAHVLGWWGKAVMIRNQLLLWVLSVGFELMELTFRHMLPNFNECWWDSIWAGMHTVRYFDGKTYEWVGLSHQPSIMGKKSGCLVCSLVSLIPEFLSNWFILRKLVKFTLSSLVNHFRCGRNPLVVYWLILWWLIAIPAIREYNTYLQDRKPVKKVGAFCWLSLAICMVELLICMKFGHGLFQDPMPTWLITFWICVGISLALFLLEWSRRDHLRSIKQL
uniref:CDP-diacylglycerol--serine O-phosphatidyltransferase n=1 Tax=Oryza meridionalis TaxID=40149 RepID=A0A0E0C663_9ORYZ